LRDSAEAIATFKVKMFVVCCDSVEKVEGFAEKLNAPYPILSDDDRIASKKFGVDRALGLSRRFTFYFGSEGKLRFIDKKVSVGTHGQDVIKRLEELGFEKKQD